MELIDGGVKIQWVDIGEGLDGYYNSEDPEDVALLRFDVLVWNGTDWEQVDDGSYCTMMPVDTDKDTLRLALVTLMNNVWEAMSNGGSVKRVCEELSWMNPDWFERTNF